jgi:hypothetical protein
MCWICAHPGATERDYQNYMRQLINTHGLAAMCITAASACRLRSPRCRRPLPFRPWPQIRAEHEPGTCLSMAAVSRAGEATQNRASSTDGSLTDIG